MADSQKEALIDVRGLRKYFPIRKGIFGRHVGDVKAVDDISFTIRPMETVGLVGESGCGKTTAGRSLLRLIEPSAGQALYKGRDLFTLSEKEMRAVRRNLQIIFQDPYSSLNPRMTVESLIGEAMLVHGVATEQDVRERVEGLLERVGLQASYVSRYPHEFSGGQRQRIGIARALALSPEFIVCDEAVSALDVSVQAQVVNLLRDLQEEYRLSFLFIAHDLSIVRHISDRIAVMYLGRMVEIADCDELFAAPAHPYTQALLSAIPHPDPRQVRERVILQGDVPTPINPPKGCRFHTRCPAAYARCREEIPELTTVGSGHKVACHLYTEPSRSGMLLSQAQLQVAAMVAAGATTTLTGSRKARAEERERRARVAAEGSAAPIDSEPSVDDQVQEVVRRIATETASHLAVEAAPGALAGAQHTGLTDEQTATDLRTTPSPVESPTEASEASDQRDISAQEPAMEATESTGGESGQAHTPKPETDETS